VSSVPRKILICDDEEVLRALVRATLDDGSFEVLEAEDGDESVALARSEKPDVILLDMMMPGRSGLEVLELLRGDPELAQTPVVMLTARTRVSDQEAALAAGADRYLAKPFSPLELISIIEELLETGR
jgi:CheY-like chemotaxis protein